MSEQKEFFERRHEGWEEAYKAFFARREAEAKEKLTETCKPHYCRCPYPYETTANNGICRFLGDTDICARPMIVLIQACRLLVIFMVYHFGL